MPPAPDWFHGWKLPPGQHYRFLDATLDGRPSRRPYYLSLPDRLTLADERGRLPLIVFLHGIVEGGEDHQRLFIEAIPLYLRDRPEFRAAYPFVFLCPQAPYTARFESDAVSGFVLRCIEQVLAEHPVDPERVYLTGLSNGGTGTWAIAMRRPDLFAAIAPISARAWRPEEAGTILRNIPAWLAVGGEDGDFVHAARHMRDRLRAAGGSAELTIVPRFGHVIWDQAYLDPRLYGWLLRHRRGGRRGTVALSADVLADPAATAAVLDASMKRALRLSEAGRDVDAFRSYRLIASTFPGTREAARAARELESLEADADFARRYKTAQDQESASQMLRIGDDYADQGDLVAAEKAWTQARDVWPDSPAAGQAARRLNAPVRPGKPN